MEDVINFFRENQCVTLLVVVVVLMCLCKYRQKMKEKEAFAQYEMGGRLHQVGKPLHKGSYATTEQSGRPKFYWLKDNLW